MAGPCSHDVLGIRLDDLTTHDLRERLRAWLSGSVLRVVATPNPEFVLQAIRDPRFREVLNKADLLLPDGIGLKYAVAALSDVKLENRQTGVDLVEELAALCAKEGKSLLLFGGLPGSAQTTAEALQSRYRTLRVHWYEPGILTLRPDGVSVPPAVIDVLRRYKPDAIAVALGQEKQERFIVEYASSMPTVRIAVGVGGAFEMLADRLPRAPRWMRRAGLEWLWRLRLEPRRFRRIFRAVIVFPVVVAWATLKQRRFFHACRNVFQEVIK